MLAKNYPKIVSFFLIIHLFLWDILGGEYHLKAFILLLPIIYFLANTDIFNKNWNFLKEFNNQNFKNDRKIIFTFIILCFLLFFQKIFFLEGFNLENQKYSLLKIPIILITIYIFYFNFEIIKKNFEKIITYSIILISILFFFEIILNYNHKLSNINKFALINNCYDGFFVKYSLIFLEDSHYAMMVPGLILSYLTILLKNKKSLIYYIPIFFLIIATIFLGLSITFLFAIFLASFICFLSVKEIKFKIIYFFIILIFASSAIYYPRCAVKTMVLTNGFLERIPNFCKHKFTKSLCETINVAYSISKTREEAVFLPTSSRNTYLKKKKEEIIAIKDSKNQIIIEKDYAITFPQTDINNKSIPDKNKIIPDKNKSIPDKNKSIPDKNKSIPDKNKSISNKNQDKTEPIQLIKPKTDVTCAKAIETKYQYDTSEMSLLSNCFIYMQPDLSQAVYINSFKILILGLKENIFGSGIDSYKDLFKKYVNKTYKNLSRDKDINIIIPVLNNNDGSNNFVKLSLELGIFSLPLYFFIVHFIFNRKIRLEIKVFVLTIVITQLFIRGSGYFNGGFLFASTVIVLSYFKIRTNNQNAKKLL